MNSQSLACNSSVESALFIFKSQQFANFCPQTLDNNVFIYLFKCFYLFIYSFVVHSTNAVVKY